VTLYVGNSLISSDETYFIISIYPSKGDATLYKYSLPSFKMLDKSPLQTENPYLFQIPANNSYSNFFIANTTYGLTYHNDNWPEWDEGALVHDQNTTFYLNGISYGISSDECFYVAGQGAKGIYSTVTQVYLTTPLAEPQELIAQITVPLNNEYISILGASSDSLFVTDLEKVYTYPVTCSL